MFVDLASISAGENDMDVDRVACFHDAVLGYSPMLYELKPLSGFDLFKEVLKKLWKALDNDPNLPTKLVSLPSVCLHITNMNLFVIVSSVSQDVSVAMCCVNSVICST